MGIVWKTGSLLALILRFRYLTPTRIIKRNDNFSQTPAGTEKKEGSSTALMLAWYVPPSLPNKHPSAGQELRLYTPKTSLGMALQFLQLRVSNRMSCDPRP